MEDFDVLIEDDRWETVDLERLAQGAAEATLRHLGLTPDAAELTLLACDDTRIAALNNDFRGKARATNVLSWPAEERGSAIPGGDPLPVSPGVDGMVELGDIALAYQTCAAEAEAADKPLADHVTHLIVHGLLHLLGYDHENDPDALLMEGLETEILGKMGLDDPYRENGPRGLS
ncbi:rRNA maturation RNase YbeY [Sulfitobacter delicatus]|uniref:Endoribonuclease YbeY n=1 Tax=Sulfitobacter delicatus TaxID=218672 RepID=A0A1G7U0G1_9RHOB|nr:rRNA maturation RNase YbeY [Sulfitobacter delicatus]SDG41036.1 probable rRNA maturation factor [Sulfitobacter delicatus]